MTDINTILAEIRCERERQKFGEGFSEDHDDAYEAHELERAAACYALNDATLWPWDWNWWKPKSERENLIRAGALLVAALESHARKKKKGRLESRPEV